jgi:hypothetical protein
LRLACSRRTSSCALRRRSGRTDRP